MLLQKKRVLFAKKSIRVLVSSSQHHCSQGLIEPAQIKTATQEVIFQEPKQKALKRDSSLLSRLLPLHCVIFMG